eukprot:jgi/Psemu1/293581/fgenesh1_pg.2772_\
MCRSDAGVINVGDSVDNANDEQTQEIIESLAGVVVTESSLSRGRSPSSADKSIKTDDVTESTARLQKIIPSVVWIEHILPFLDRPAWNALMEASKELYLLTTLSKLTADYNDQTTAHGVAPTRAAIQPPWPTNRPFLSKMSGGQGQAIESFSLSHDGEYLACGSVIGTIELWNLRTGKLAWKTTSRNYYERIEDSTGKVIVPMGSLLKFSPVRYVLACGFEHKIVLWDLSGAIREYRERSLRQRRRTPGRYPDEQCRVNADDHSLSSFQTPLEINCRKGKIYEVTYLEFSQDARRLIARYGKTAYVWTLSSKHGSGLFAHCLTHTIPLVSSRSLMVLDPIRMRLALAINESSGNSGGRSSSRTGLVHVWDLPENAEAEEKQVANSVAITTTTTTTISSSSTILAYPNHVVRGLDFLRLESSVSPTALDDCLVTASLQGELKFWKRQPSKLSHDPSSSSNNNDYFCVCRFQSPGKIFSLASWSPPLVSSFSSRVGTKASVFLAAGEAKGGVRVWKVSTSVLQSNASTEDSENLDHPSAYNSENDGHQNYLLNECLSTQVGDHVHYDNIKMLSFTHNGQSLVVSRAYDAKIWFQSV